MTYFDGEVFLITGGAGGIGKATATAIAEAGRSAVKEIEVATGGSLRFEPLDVTDPAAVASCAQQLDDDGWPVYGLMANAGIAPSSAAVDYPNELWLKTVDINLNGVFWCCREFGKRMIDKGAGAIVVNSSIAGFKVVSPERHVAYGTTKAAVAHMAKLLGVEWAGSGVRVNAIAPGYTATPILDKLEADSPETYNEWVSRTPLGRLNDPVEIANATVFLLSKQSSGTTGTVLHVDGGYSAR